MLTNVAMGGDIDLLVRDPQQAERQLVADLGTPLFVARRSYVTGLFYDWGHVDLLSTLEWRGARYLDTAAVLQDRDLSPSGLARPRPAHEALVSWFSSLLWGGFFKPRYRDVIVEAAREDGDEWSRSAERCRKALGSSSMAVRGIQPTRGVAVVGWPSAPGGVMSGTGSSSDADDRRWAALLPR